MPSMSYRWDVRELKGNMYADLSIWNNPSCYGSAISSGGHSHEMTKDCFGGFGGAINGGDRMRSGLFEFTHLDDNENPPKIVRFADKLRGRMYV